MAVNFRFGGERAIDQIGFGWSPLFEAVLSLRAVVRPKHIPLHLPWARRCRELPDDLLAEIDALIGAFDDAVPGAFEIGLLGRHPSFDAELDALAALDLDRFAFEVTIACGAVACGLHDGADATVVHDRTYRDEVLAVDRADTARLALLRAAFDDPAGLLERYVAMLRRYWDEAFVDEWARIRDRIETEVTAGARALVTGGISGVAAQLLPEARWDADHAALVIERDWDEDVDVRARGGLLLVPTMYGWPRVLIELGEPWPLAIFFPLRDLRAPEVPHATDGEVVDGLRALGDPTRLQIARLIADADRSTKELAELLSLSDSAISRHLKILEGAGLVSGRRDGYFVLYRLRTERLDVLGAALRSTLGLAPARSGAVPALPVEVRQEPVPSIDA